MAGGPIAPISVYLGNAAGNLFPNFHSGAGANAAPRDEGVGCIASLNAAAADPVAELRFPMPPSIPSGTLKLMMRALANATTGNAKATVSDGTCPAETSPSGVTLTSETQSTVAWGSGDNDQYKDTKVTLSATPAGNDMLVVAVTFNRTSWTLAQESTWIFWVLWE